MEYSVPVKVRSPFVQSLYGLRHVNSRRSAKTQSPEVSEKTIGRLSQYRRILKDLQNHAMVNVYSHELARRARVSAAQVRRDLMVIGYSGNPHSGYEIIELIESISAFLDDPQVQKVALIGVGSLGKAILSHFAGNGNRLQISATFDLSETHVGGVVGGCRCHPIEELAQVAREENISVGLIAVSSADAQVAADHFIEAGVHSLVNVTPTALQVPDYVHVESLDITMSVERAAFYARHRE